jgi:hypothetical protein
MFVPGVELGVSRADFVFPEFAATESGEVRRKKTF